MRRYKIIGIFIGAFALCAAAFNAHAEDWLPVTPEELKMTSEPKAPIAPAIYLYRQVDRNDNGPDEVVYSRIKILNEEGRKYADVEIPYNKASESVRSIQARTIRPDGTIATFNGTIFEKPILKGRGVKLLAKTFTLPDVQVGSIVEYRYRHSFASGFVFDSHWILSDELFTRHAKFSLNPYAEFSLRYSWPVGLPPGTDPPKKEHGDIRLEVHDVPAFVTEEYMPPENELKYRVDFIYFSESSIEKVPADFWRKLGKEQYRSTESFIDKRRVMEQAVAEIVAPGDSPETKLRKIYTRTQQIRNLSFERAKSDQEVKRESKKEVSNVAGVWKLGYGDATEVNWLFLGLARAAGFKADPVFVSTRDSYFFNLNMMNPHQLNSNVVVVNLEGKDMYLDPGTALAPFGVLPWNETAIKGLRLDKNGGTWINTPLPVALESRVDRKATFKLTTNGALEGKVVVTYSGLEALWRRLEERNEDDADRKQFLEDQIKADIPTGIDVELSNQPKWNSSEVTLVAEYDVKIPGWASAAGQRALLPMGLFGGRQKQMFKHASRIHPLYFSFPHTTKDDVTIELPNGWQVASMPQPQDKDIPVFGFHTSAADKNGSLQLNRELVVNVLLLDVKFYSQLRDLFQSVRAVDEEQLVLTPGKSSTQTPDKLPGKLPAKLPAKVPVKLPVKLPAQSSSQH